MIQFDILGCGHNAISMICDTLFKIHGNKVGIRIVKNFPVNDAMPYKIDGFKFEEVESDKWEPSPKIKIIMGVMNVKNKKIVYDFFKDNKSINFQNYCNLLHPFASIAETVTLGDGIFLSAGNITEPYSKIGNMVTINRNVSIGHHTKISNFCTINPGSNIAGHCDIGEYVTIGMGSNIIDGIKIGRNTIVGAGSLVLKDLPENIVAYGSPAKTIRINEEQAF